MSATFDGVIVTTKVELTPTFRELIRGRVAAALHGDAYEGVDPKGRQDIDTAIDAVLAGLAEASI